MDHLQERLERIEARLAILVERQQVKEWYSWVAFRWQKGAIVNVAGPETETGCGGARVG